MLCCVVFVTLLFSSRVLLRSCPPRSKMGCQSSSAAGAARHPAPGGPVLNAQAGGVRALHLPAPWKANIPVTLAKLEMDRATFWDTTARVQGNPRVWETLRVACDAMMHNDAELASTILDAGDIKSPEGTLAVTYDARGFMYEIPLYCYSSPSNIISDEEASTPKRSGHKGPVSDLPITVRLSSSARTTEQDVTLVIKSSDTIADLKRMLHSSLLEGTFDRQASSAATPPTQRRGEGNRWAGVGLPTTHQRVLWCGRGLPDACNMQECGVVPHAILQVFIKPPRS